MARGPVAGIVLAGGAGTRLGMGPPKALRMLAGVTLLDHAVRVVWARAAFVFVAVPAAFPLPRGPYERVNDLAQGGGPLVGLVPALEAAADRGARVAWTLAVDLPWIAPVHLDVLTRALDAGGDDALAAVPRSSRGLEPLCAVYRPGGAAPWLRAAWKDGERAVHRALARLGPALVEVRTEVPGVWPGGESTLESVNTLEDLEAAERRLGEGADWIEEGPED